MTNKEFEDFLKEYNEIKSIEGTVKILEKYKDTEYFPILKALLVGELNGMGKATEIAYKIMNK